MTDRPALRLVPTWTRNAEAWTAAVREGNIPSRRAGTDAAVVEAVVGGLPPAGRVLDVGCGEGWLARALGALGASVHGVDASAPLVEAARAEGGAGVTYDVLDYEAAAADPDRLGGPYDVAVFNFSLLDDRAAAPLRAAAAVLERGGRIVVQTVHPLTAGAPYADGWREETFDGVEGDFEPMPWFFRTLGSWVRVVTAAGLRLTDVVEPADTDAPLSLILVAEAV
ncbi:class I SAM-dependent methyltransferase [Rubrivirga litoralis]|uniref:Methyltransferase domain-containing protein n=1 Tax=Rubrivirga litoralis TaxID=3075598 RepID=A0ABU3BQS8_9BACT|nr:methyltransferase domain-containing protein [Rubrivirga sp. F394]MDT0631630.1 methyltransferase domain-containing protein [Rubrivirga sp. F394]